jgi:ABC-type cobalamin/Fe3+-siderophores transport system ATPase subunit
MSEVSGGERLRILMARALAVGADLLLADEPIAALDARHQLQVMELLQKTARQDRGVVVVFMIWRWPAGIATGLCCLPTAVSSQMEHQVRF